MVVFEKCDWRTDKCKSDADIDEWLKQKYIVVLENNKVFSQREFDKKSIDQNSFLKWYSMSPDQRIEYVNVIERQQFNLNDSFLAFGSLTESDTKGFKSTKTPNRVLNYKNNMLNSVTYELSLGLEFYDRQVYNLLDILSDIGGLYGALSAIFFFIVSIFQFRGDHMFMMKDVFNSEEKSFKSLSHFER